MTNLNSTFSSPLSRDITASIPLAPIKLEDKLVVLLNPHLSREIAYDFSDKQCSILAPPSQESEVAEKVSDYLKENSGKLTALIQECQIESTSRENSQIIIGGQQEIFQKRLKQMVRSFKEKHHGIESNGLQSTIKQQLLKEAWSSLCWARALKDLEETKIALSKKPDKKSQDALRVTDVFLKNSAGKPYKAIRLLQARQLTWQNKAMQQDAGSVENIEEAYKECKREFDQVFKESSLAKLRGWLKEMPSMQKSIPEQDYEDLLFTEKNQGKIGSLYLRMNQLARMIKESHKEFKELHAQMELLFHLTTFRVHYFENEEKLEEAINQLTAQAIDWNNYSPSPCVRAYEELSRMHQLVQDSPAKIQEEAKKKVKWHTQFVLDEMEDFMEELKEEIEAELSECEIQQAAGSLKKLQKDCSLFIAELEKTVEISLPTECKNRIIDDLVKLRQCNKRVDSALQKAIKQHWEDKSTNGEAKSQEKKRRIAQKIFNEIGQSDWNDTTKRIIHTLFVGLQLSQDLQKMWRLPEEVKWLRAKEAEEFQKQIAENVPKEIKAVIDKEGSIVDRLVTDQYDTLKKPGAQEDVQRRYPHIRKTLKDIVEKFGDTKPTPDQLKRIIETHRMNRLMEASIAATPSLSERIGNWWLLFTTGSQETEQVKSVFIPSLPPSEIFNTALAEREPETSSAARPGSILIKLATALGFFGIEGYLDKVQPYQDNIKKILQQKSTLQEDLERLSECRRQVELQREQFAAISSILSEQAELEALDKELEQMETKLQHFINQTPQEQTPSQLVHKWLRSFNSQKEEVDRTLKAFDKLNLAKQTEAREILKEMIEGEPLTIENELLLHVLGNLFGSKTGLEGYNHFNILLFKLKLLNKKIQVLSKRQNNRLVDLLNWLGIDVSVKIPDQQKLFEQLLNAIKLFEAMQGDIVAFAEIFKLSLVNLKPNESLLLPGGWFGKPTGHGVYYEYIKQEDGQYTMRIYNTGSGLDYHSKRTVEFKEKALTFIESINIPLDSLIRLPILTAMKELLGPYPHSYGGASWEAKDIYETIRKMIGGEPSPVVYTQEDLHDPQLSEVCAMMSLMTALTHRTENENKFLKSQFEMQFKTLVDYSKRVEPDWDERSFRLFQKSTEVFAHEVTSYHEKGIINQLEFVYALKKVQEIQLQLKQIEETLLKKIETDSHVVSLNKVYNQLRVGAYEIHVVEAAGEQQVPTLLPRHYVNVSNWKPTPERLKEDLEGFHCQIAEALKDQNYKAALNGLQDVMLTLPLEWFDDRHQELWKQVSYDDAMSIIHTLSEMSHIRFESLIKEMQNDPERLAELEPKQFLAHYKGYTIAHKLAGQYQNEMPLPLSTLHDPVFVDFFKEEEVLSDKEKNPPASLYFRFYDPKWDEAFNQIRHYWNTQDLSRTYETSSRLKYAPPIPRGNNHSSSYVSSYSKESEWTRDELKCNPEAYKKLTERMEGFQYMSPDFQAGYAAADIAESRLMTRDILPQPYYDLRDMLYIGNYLLLSPLVPTQKGSTEPLKIVFRMAKSSYDLVYIHAEVPGIDHEESAQIYQQYAADPSLFFRLSKAHRMILKPHLLKLGALTPNDRILLEKSHTSSSFELEEWREFAAMANNGPKLQVKAVLEFFIKHYQLFEDSDYRTLFDILIFKPGLFLDEFFNFQIEDKQQLISVLTSFTNENFHRYLDYNKIETACHFLYLNEMFKHYTLEAIKMEEKAVVGKTESFLSELYHYIMGTSQESVPTRKLSESVTLPFLNTRDEARKLLKKSDLSEEARSQLSHLLVLTYRDQLNLKDEEEFSEFFSAAMTYKLPLDTKERQKELLVEELSYRFCQQIEDLSEEQRNGILNKILTHTHPELAEKTRALTWKPHPMAPQFTSNDDNYIFNFQTAKLYENQGSHAMLPSLVTKSLDFVRVFITLGPLQVNQLNLSTYQVTTKDGHTYRIILKNGTRLIIQRLFIDNGENRWLEYFSQYQARTSKKALALDYQHWYCDSPPQLLIFDKNHPHPLYRLSFSRELYTGQPEHEGHCYIDEFQRLDALGNNTNQILVNTVNNTEFFNHLNIEDEEYTLCWKDKITNELKQLELPRFKLTFEVRKINEEPKAFSKEFPGYFLAQKQWVPALKGFAHFLLLENAEGEQKVLLPFKQLISDAHALDTQKIKFDHQLDSHSQRFLEYKIDKKTGALISATEEGRLFFGYLTSRIMEYGTANSFLRGNKASTRPYTSAEVEILRYIAAADDEHQSPDADPRAIAIRLYASYLLIKNELDFADSTYDVKTRELAHDGVELVLEKLSKNYTHYLTVLDHVDPARLKPEEELLLLQQIKTLSPAMLNRLRILDPSKRLEISTIQPVSEDEAISAAIIEKPTSFSIDSDCFDVLFRDFSSSASQTPPLILRASLSISFIDYYRMVRGELNDKAFKQVYARMTGISDLPKSNQERKKELELVLKMMRQNSTPHNQSIAAILEAVLNNPKQFPNSDRVRYLLEKIKKNPFIEELINPTLRYIAATEKGKTPGTINKIAAPHKKRALKPVQNQAKFQQLELPYQSCIALDGPTELMTPPIENLDLYVEQTSLPGKSSSAIQDELVGLFIPLTEDRLLKEEFKSVQNSIKAYGEQNSSTKYEITDFQKWKSLSAELNDHLSKGQVRLVEKEMALIQKANKSASSELEQARKKFKALSHGIKHLAIDDLIKLFLQQDRELFHQANPSLSPDDISVLSHEIMDYLIHSTHLQHMQRLSDQIKAIQTAKANQVSAEELSLVIKEFMANASSTRAYQIEEHPSYLVFEHYMGILLRSDQINTLDQLQLRGGKIGNPEALGKVVEMIMGAGKTSVLLPILLYMIADGDQLAMAILPEALLPSMSQELAQRVGPSFGQTVHVIEYRRDMPNTTEKLTRILTQLREIQENREALLMSSTTIQSLYLKFVETLYLYSHQEPSTAISSLEINIELFRELFRFFKEKGHLIIDEADLILNARKEHHFTLGNPIALPTHNLDLVSSLYLILSTYPEIISKINLDFTQEGKGVPFTKDGYREMAAPLLVREILNKQLGVSDPDVKEYFDNLATHERGYLERYLSNEKDQTAYTFVRQIDSSKIKDLLALAREEIHKLLPLTNDKMCDENYGKSPSLLSSIAIPYHGSNNPAVKSQFGNPYETLNYTFQLYLKKGIPVSLVKKEVETLQKQALVDLQRNKLLNESAAYKKFMEMCGHDARFQLFGSQNQFHDLTKKINDNPAIKVHFIKKYIAPEIVSYSLTLSANPQLYNFLVKKVEGFTGTLWNSDTFPEGLKAIPVTETIAKTLTVLWQNSKDKVHTIPKVDPQHFVEKLMSDQPFSAKSHALIDAGGLGRGLENEVAARHLLAAANNQNRTPPINGVIFYGSSEQLLILEKGKPVPVPLNQSMIPKEERITLYDQMHTTGADIKQAFSAIGLVTINQHTTLRNLLQSVSRMRGLDLGQKVEFVVDEEVKELIQSTLEKVMGREKEEELTLASILLFVTYNQAILKGDNNYRALKHKMKAILQREIVGVILDPTIEVKAIRDLFLEVESLFVTVNVNSTWDMLGDLEEKKESRLVIKSRVEALKNSQLFQALEQQPLLKTRVDAQSLNVEVEKLAQKSLNALPEKLAIGHEGYGIEAEKEMETEKERQEDIPVNIYKTKAPIPLNLKRFYAPDFFIGSSVSAIKQTMDRIPGQNIKTFEIYQIRFINPFVNLNEALSTSEVFKPYLNVFDPAISGSLNLFQIYNAGSETAPYSPFDQYQKEISSLMIVENKKTGALNFALLDQYDEQEIKGKLIQDCQQDDGIRKSTRLCLYGFNYGPYMHGPDRVDMDRIASSPQFLNALAQIKFLRGEINYSKEELPYLKKWIEKHDPKKMFELFKLVTRWKPSVQADLPNSDLGDLFKEVGPFL